jgi:hypothetical protein
MRGQFAKFLPLHMGTAARFFEQLLQSPPVQSARIPSAIGLTMMVFRRRRLPLVPLLHSYRASGILDFEELTQLPGAGPRFRAVIAAKSAFLNDAFLDTASANAFEAALVDFYERCVQPPLHTETVRRRASVIRHGLGHLLRCADAPSRKLERCLAADGPYHVSGFGPAFWTALLQGLDPTRHAAWTPGVIHGLARLGLACWRPGERPAKLYSSIQAAYAQIREREPAVSALHIDHFLTLVAAMRGRDLWSGTERLAAGMFLCDIADRVRRQRSHSPLRRRLKELGRALHQARRDLEQGLASQDGTRIGAAVVLADPDSSRRAPIDWERNAAALALWAGRLWEADDPYEVLEAFWKSEPIPGAGLWLPAALLHLRDARRFQPWNERIRQGYASLDDCLTFTGSVAERYRCFNEGVVSLCNQNHIHPLEVPSLLAARTDDPEDPPETVVPAGTGPWLSFGGFCSDTFRFLAELAQNNCRQWMELQRARYRFAVREPLVELCQVLARSYIEPVLHQTYSWRLETAARIGRSLTSICKNNYGQSAPYHSALWITFFRQDKDSVDIPGREHKRAGVQFFVRLDAAGLRYGLRLSEKGHGASLLQKRLTEHGRCLYRLLSENGALADCSFGDEQESGVRVARPEELEHWAVAGKSLLVCKIVPATSPLATAGELAGDILLTLDRLSPLYACAVEPDLQAWLARIGQAFQSDSNPSQAGKPDLQADFYRATFLDPNWLQRGRDLLNLKHQIILQGVPGTGKTHVARSLALVLTGGRSDAVRLVQFHPAYSYEEFVEGIRVRSVEVNGRQDVTYPVEDGILATLAAEAANRPDQVHVLIIDEINRGNLPRIFGELLYLLEYRGETVRLLYSKREFRLPANLYLIGTMNAADRSVALIDQALRRRFSFLDMPPDVSVLAAWLKEHPPAVGDDFVGQVIALFDRLNTRLRHDLGPHYQIGHSYFMVPDLDESRLQVIWDHHVLPLLEEYFHGHPDQAEAYALDRLLSGGRRTPAGRKRRAAGVQR